MLSALIQSEYSYPAMLLTEQLAHQGFVQASPLVLGSTPLKIPTDILDRVRAVLRRSEPSSRTLLTGEQPDPWDLLQPQDRMSRHRNIPKNGILHSSFLKRSDYIFTLIIVRGQRVIELISIYSQSHS